MTRPLRLALRITALLTAAAVLYVAATLMNVWLESREDEARPVEAIVVLGAAQYDGIPSDILRARLDHAADLWRRWPNSQVVVTGGNRPGDRFTEATAGAFYLEDQHGIPDDKIIRVTDGRNTYESLAAATRVLRERGIDRILLVSDPFHSARLKGIAGELGVPGWTSPTRTSPIKGFSAFLEMCRETAAVSVGRVIGYRRLMRVRDEIPAG